MYGADWCVGETRRDVQQRELVLSSDERVLLVNQHEPLLHHGLLLLLVVACEQHTQKNSYTNDR